jgi:hypothetical protein
MMANQRVKLQVGDTVVRWNYTNDNLMFGIVKSLSAQMMVVTVSGSSFTRERPIEWQKITEDDMPRIVATLTALKEARKNMNAVMEPFPYGEVK